MQTSASGLATYLGQEADALSLPPATLVAANAGSPSMIATNAITAVKNLPTWAKVAGVAVVSLGAIGIAMHVKKKHGSFAGLLGLS
jgi:hypothetical protein